MKSIRLCYGEGSRKEAKACWMSAVHYYTSKRGWSDQPKCVSPVIAELCVELNDSLSSDKARGRIIGPHLFAPVGTKTNYEDEKRRFNLCLAKVKRLVSRTRSVELELTNQMVIAEDFAAHGVFKDAVAYLLPTIRMLARRARNKDQWLKRHLLPLILQCCEVGKVDVKAARPQSKVLDLITV